jgi:hypothetical protein
MSQAINQIKDLRSNPPERDSFLLLRARRSLFPYPGIFLVVIFQTLNSYRVRALIVGKLLLYSAVQFRTAQSDGEI